MIDAGQNGQQDDQSEASIPSPRPVYSTKDYANKNRTPPPPPPQSSAVRDRVRKRRRNQRGNSASEWVWVVVAAALFAVVLVVSFGAFVIIQASSTETIPLPTANVALPTAVVARNDFSGEIVDDTLLLDDGSSIILEPWDGQSRFTMVLVGLDRRPGETGLAYRTDTMMLVSIDPVSNTIGILSLPRDTYVAIDGYASRQRINSAMVLGEIQQVGYGPTLMRRTITRNFGMTVHDYMAVDFQAFIDLVDAVGGVEVETTYTINDQQYPSMNYGYDPFYLPAGKNFLEGYDALRFARTRHGDSDISRAERQQQVIYALRDRILDFDMAPSLIARAPALWSSWQDNVYTGLTLEQIIQLSLYVRDVPRENITMGVLDYQYLQSWSTPEGASVLIPNVSRLSELMLSVFGSDYNQ
ncbi:MAG: LCP family protein [Phototrophicaceae bacterium]